MSATGVVKFNRSLNQLSESERQAFISQLLVLDESNNIIAKALTQCFIHLPNLTQNINNIILTIIRKRKKIPIEPDQFKLDKIPEALIGHIASFTPHQDFANLSAVNRWIYLGCNALKSMTTKKAVRFNNLLNQLSESEKQIFISQLLVLNKSNSIIAKALTQCFIYLPNQAPNVNNIISTIIRNREKIPIETQQYKLDMIPKALIGHISSFAVQRDFSNLSIINRSVYLGCNEPNMLHKLWLSRNEQYLNIKLELYPSVKYLGFGLEEFNQLLSKSPQPIFNRLEGLRFIGDWGHSGNQELQSFVENNTLNLSTITKLSCFIDNYGDNKDLFTKLLSNFSNLQFLDLGRVLCDLDVDVISKILPNLKGLQVGFYTDDETGIPYPSNEDLIHVFADQLEYLSIIIDLFHQIDFRLNCLDFKKLQYLKVYDINTKCLNDILKTAVNLRKIDINTSYSVTLSELESIVIHIFNKCHSLEFIKFDTKEDSDKLIGILNGIEKGLIQSKKRRTRQMKIKIGMTRFDDTEKARGVTSNIGKVIQLLEMSNIEDVMFIWDIRDHFLIDDEILMGDIVLECMKCEIYADLTNDMTIIISNKNCKINRYHETNPFDI